MWRSILIYLKISEKYVKLLSLVSGLATKSPQMDLKTEYHVEIIEWGNLIP